MIKGIIFDLDGTLIDSMGIWSKIDGEFLRENGVENPPTDVGDAIRKMTLDEAAEYFISRFNLDCTVDYVNNRIEELAYRHYESLIPLKPNVIKLMDYLDENKIPYGIATATYKSMAETVLKRFCIYDRLSFLLTEADYPQGKDFPDIFLGGAEKMGLEPASVLVVEDSLHCIETAKTAGFVTVGVSDDVSAGDREEIKKLADYFVDDLDEILAILC